MSSAESSPSGQEKDRSRRHLTTRLDCSRAICGVHAFFLQEMSRQLTGNINETRLASLLATSDALLRSIERHDGSIPISEVAGSYACGTGATKYHEFDAIAEQYIRRDDISGSLKAAAHHEALGYADDLRRLDRIDVPIAPIRLRGAPRTESVAMRIEKERLVHHLEILRSVRIFQSQILLTIREYMQRVKLLQQRLSNIQSQDLEQVKKELTSTWQAIGREIAHAKNHVAHYVYTALTAAGEEKKTVVSVPLLLGCTYNELMHDKRGQPDAPSVQEFLNMHPPSRPEDFLKFPNPDTYFVRGMDAARVYLDVINARDYKYWKGAEMIEFHEREGQQSSNKKE